MQTHTSRPDTHFRQSVEPSSTSLSLDGINNKLYSQYLDRTHTFDLFQLAHNNAHVSIQWWQMGRPWKTKMLLTQIPRWVSAQLLFQPAYNGDNYNVVRIFMSLSCKLWALFTYVTHLFPYHAWVYFLQIPSDPSRSHLTAITMMKYTIPTVIQCNHVTTTFLYLTDHGDKLISLETLLQFFTAVIYPTNGSVNAYWNRLPSE